MPSRRSSLSLNQRLTLLLATLTIVTAIVIAFISGHDWFQSQPLSSVSSISPTPLSGKIIFASTESSDALNSDLQWDAGSSEMSMYRLAGETMTLTAGSHTWPNFPMINYKPVVNGDFSVSVKMTFIPEAPVIKTAQMAGILIHPVNAHLAQSNNEFPNDWIAASKNITDSGSLVGCRGSWVDYSADSVFLRIERSNDSWRCAYGSNGENWYYLDVTVNDAQLQNQQLVISLFAYSDTDNPITVKFSGWEINYGK